MAKECAGRYLITHRFSFLGAVGPVRQLMLNGLEKQLTLLSFKPTGMPLATRVVSGRSSVKFS